MEHKEITYGATHILEKRETYGWKMIAVKSAFSDSEAILVLQELKKLCVGASDASVEYRVRSEITRTVQSTFVVENFGTVGETVRLW